MKFWKEHTALRLTLMAVLFAGGLALIVFGWSKTGELGGLGLMLLGIVALLAALAVYNFPFEEPRKKSK